MSDAPELKNCPFCGKPAKLFAPNMVICTDTVSCGAEVNSGDSGDMTQDYTVSAWNKRAAPGWRSIKDQQPEHGQKIVGFAYCHENEAGAHGVWDEVWDKDEPFGAMTHWIPVPDKS